uniref:Uncharacterized protein n=1 Tax=Romanomermis culicivorax TaxID=13658 RepID=A0A915IY94_ROMCU
MCLVIDAFPYTSAMDKHGFFNFAHLAKIWPLHMKKFSVFLQYKFQFPLSIGKYKCDLAEKDRWQAPTEPKRTEISVPFRYVPSIAFRSVPPKKARNRCPGGIQCCLDLCKCNGYTSAHCRFYTTNEKICECSNDEFLTRQIPPKECKN